MCKIIRVVLTILVIFAFTSSFLYAAEMPNVENIIETFIPIQVSKDATSLQAWQDYLDMLRSVVAPLVRDLTQRGAINWYCFLVHNWKSGVPTSKDDDRLYVHLRMALTKASNEAEFINQLPSFCRFSRKMSMPNPPRLDNVDIQSLAKGQVEQGWKILGESSEWVLKMLDAHDPNKQVPPQNVAQFSITSETNYLSKMFKFKCHEHFYFARSISRSAPQYLRPPDFDTHAIC